MINPTHQLHCQFVALRHDNDYDEFQSLTLSNYALTPLCLTLIVLIAVMYLKIYILYIMPSNKCALRFIILWDAIVL